MANIIIGGESGCLGLRAADFEAITVLTVWIASGRKRVGIGASLLIPLV